MKLSRESNNGARAIVKLVEQQTGKELSLVVCMAIAAEVQVAINNSAPKEKPLIGRNGPAPKDRPAPPPAPPPPRARFRNVMIIDGTRDPLDGGPR